MFLQVAQSTDLVDVQETRADVMALVQEESDVRDIPDETIAGAKIEPPPQRVEPVLEGVQPEDVATELQDNIKEVCNPWRRCKVQRWHACRR